jgi:hypothetical protein
MVSKKAVDMANLRLAMSENNKKVKECVQSSEKTLQNQVDELKESAVTPEEKASWKNQNAFSAIVVEGTKVKAQDIADTLALTAGDNVSLVPDPDSKQIVIKAEDTKYTHPDSGVAAGTYRNVTVDEHGHVVAGDNPTTLAGYGITDAEEKGAANSAVSAHNTATEAHNDIRLLITELTNRLNALANSDDVTLDQMKELVEYIKDNRNLIESITVNKVNVADIIDNLITNVNNKPLSAAQGVVIKSLIDNLHDEINNNLTAHIEDNNNPHKVTKEQLELENVPNVSTNDQTPTYDEAIELTELTSGEKLSVAFSKLKLAVKKIIAVVKLLGNTNISEVGDGTCTGAINKLNTISIKSTNVVKNINIPANADISVKIDYSGIEDVIVSTFFSGINASIDNQKIDKVVPIGVNGIISAVNIKSSVEQQVTIYISVLHSKDIDASTDIVLLTVDDSYIQTADGLIFTPSI